MITSSSKENATRHADRKALHRFKYFTWVEQQGKTSAELEALWDPDFWTETFSAERVAEWDRRIDAYGPILRRYIGT